MTVRITTTSALPLADDDIVVTLRNPVLVAVGEYADEGMPDILVHVVHAVDEDGEDTREVIAELIANALAALPVGGAA